MAKQAGKGVEEFRPYVTRSIPVGANITCADNSGAKILEVINVPRHKTRASRLPAAAVGDFCNVVVKKGPAELRKQVYGAVIVRQKYALTPAIALAKTNIHASKLIVSQIVFSGKKM